jgi:hypothetical protein
MFFIKALIFMERLGKRRFSKWKLCVENFGVLKHLGAPSLRLCLTFTRKNHSKTRHDHAALFVW